MAWQQACVVSRSPRLPAAAPYRVLQLAGFTSFRRTPSVSVGAERSPIPVLRAQNLGPDDEVIVCFDFNGVARSRVAGEHGRTLISCWEARLQKCLPRAQGHTDVAGSPALLRGACGVLRARRWHFFTYSGQKRLE